MSVASPLKEYQTKDSFDFIAFRMKEWGLTRKEIIEILDFWDLKSWTTYDFPFNRLMDFIKEKGYDQKIIAKKGKFTYRMLNYLIYRYENFKANFYKRENFLPGKISDLPPEILYSKRDLTNILHYKDKPTMKPFPFTSKTFKEKWRKTRVQKEIINKRYIALRKFIQRKEWLEEEYIRLTEENKQLKQKQGN